MSETLIKIVCSACGSEKVDCFAKHKPQEQVMTMEEYITSVSQPQFVHTILIRTPMVLLCKDCGYRVEYTV